MNTLLQEHQLRQKLERHHTRNSNNKIYKAYYQHDETPVGFDRMRHNELKEVANQILLLATNANDVETINIFKS